MITNDPDQVLANNTLVITLKYLQALHAIGAFPKVGDKHFQIFFELGKKNIKVHCITCHEVDLELVEEGAKH